MTPIMVKRLDYALNFDKCVASEKNTRANKNPRYLRFMCAKAKRILHTAQESSKKYVYQKSFEREKKSEFEKQFIIELSAVMRESLGPLRERNKPCARKLRKAFEALKKTAKSYGVAIDVHKAVVDGFLKWAKV